MTRAKEEWWQRFQRFYQDYPGLGFALDISRMNFDDDFLPAMRDRVQRAFIAMNELEKGGIANPDEKRMVGHYWLRNSKLAPTATIAREIETTIEDVKSFAAAVHQGKVRGKNGPFTHLLVIGIGGSALGPQFVADALGNPATNKLQVYFLDNTDPDGFDRVFAQLKNGLGQTLCVVISKSGGTKETRNGMLEAEAAYQSSNLKFSDHAVAITGAQSELDRYAESQGWIRRFPMWDWVGGRTSELSAVGLLPAALQGFDIEQILSGARACDILTRQEKLESNPAALLALMWFYASGGRGQKDMVVLPYKDRLALFSKYLQQLVMESLGKEKDLDGKIVNQGLAVYGNKGSTDQHAYVQQLREGVPNFFVVFIEVLKDRDERGLEVEPQVTSGDYLHGFLLGTREALSEKDRESITITIAAVDPFRIGLLIALFERTVGLYASLVNINAYHQPGVEAGKRAAGNVIVLQRRILSYLAEKAGHRLTPAQIASGIGAHGDYETVFKVCAHLAANNRIGAQSGQTPFETAYWHA